MEIRDRYEDERARAAMGRPPVPYSTAPHGAGDESTVANDVSESSSPTVPIHAAPPAYAYQNRNYPVYPDEPHSAAGHGYGDPTRPSPAPSRTGMSPDAVYRISQLVYFIAGVIEILLVIRIVLRALAANPSAAFTNTIYGVTNGLVAPFAGVFPQLGFRNSVLDLSAVLALVVYSLAAWGVVKLIALLGRRQAPMR